MRRSRSGAGRQAKERGVLHSERRAADAVLALIAEEQETDSCHIVNYMVAIVSEVTDKIKSCRSV